MVEINDDLCFYYKNGNSQKRQGAKFNNPVSFE